jgi:ESAT-6 family protein
VDSLCHRRRVQVTVEPEALAEWSAHARRTGASLDARLAALDRELAPLVRTWNGPAADGFTARHRQWQQAVRDLLDTLGLLATLVDTARGNYLAASATNTRIWQAHAPSTAVVVHAMAAGDGRGKGRGRIEADLEDIRTAVRALVVAAEDLGAAWRALHTGLTGSAGMAGGVDGAGFAADYDAMATAAWQGWRRSLLMLDGIAGGLAATGNNLAAAEADSTTGPKRPFAAITASTGPVPAPPLPPIAGGDGGSATVEYLAAYWPTADPDRLRTAAATWRWSATGLRDTVRRAYSAVDGLVQASPDMALREMRRFTHAALSDDPTSGLTGVLAGTGGRIASACEGLAELTIGTRARIVDTVTRYAGQEEWYHPVADVVDLFVRFRPGAVIAAAGDAYLMSQDLSTIHDEHVRAVGYLRGELDPAGADRLARIATAIAPPRPARADTCALTSPAGATGEPVAEAQRQALIAEVVAGGGRIDPAEVVHIARGYDGRPVWLARGNGSAGLQHLLRAQRTLAFLDKGVAPADLAGLALRALAEGPPIGRPKKKNVKQDAVLRRTGKEPAFVYRIGVGRGRMVNMVVVKAQNGFIVTAYPFSKKVEPL